MISRRTTTISKLRYWPLESVLHDKYFFAMVDAEALFSFLTPMLRLHPNKRAQASDLIHHNWLEGILVQGEIDVIRRMELG
jgi:serine/threonine-protein kinase SRPK3